MKEQPAATVDVADMWEWIPDTYEPGDAVVVSWPDASEIDLHDDPAEYVAWLERAYGLVFAVSDARGAGPVVSIATDWIGGGGWHSKAEVAIAAARYYDRTMVWHKIALTRGPNRINIHRPTYTHVLAFGPGRPGVRTPDVIAPTPRLWSNGAPIGAAALIADWMAQQRNVHRVLNPCSGVGTILAAMRSVGVESRGCEIDPARASITHRTVTEGPFTVVPATGAGARIRGVANGGES